jgi:two-component system response regulator AtoC
MNVIERSVVMDFGEVIEPDHLFLEAKAPTKPQAEVSPELVGLSLQELEKRMIIETLERNHDNRTKSAEMLGISIRTLRNKLKEYESEGQRE